MAAKKAYWIGDDKDNKSVSIMRRIYVRGDEIPAKDIDKDVLDGWIADGLVSMGEKNAPIIIKDTDTIKTLEAEIKSLKADGPCAACKTKADKIKELKADVKEKAALIEKQAGELEDLTKPAADAKDSASDKDKDKGAGPDDKGKDDKPEGFGL